MAKADRIEIAIFPVAIANAMTSELSIIMLPAVARPKMLTPEFEIMVPVIFGRVRARQERHDART